MKIHEYQGSALLSEYGIRISDSALAETPQQAADIAERFGGTVVVKAQVLVGGRGKAGGVKLAHSPREAAQRAQEILALQIKGIPVRKLLIARGVNILQEYYMGIAVDRAMKQIVIMVSAAGGVEIEELAKTSPEKILKLYVNPIQGPSQDKLRQIVAQVFVDPGLAAQAFDTVMKMYRLFLDKDCSLVEINPYAKTDPRTLVAIDAKINFDDNGLFKHPEIEALRNPEEFTPEEIRAKDAGLSFVNLDGNIGCIVNGAGLAMATMDVIKLFGGEPANFLDVGGSSNPNKVLLALEIITSNKKVKAILINIFGGITRCDDIAQGILMAVKKLDLKLPMVIRLIGTKEPEGKQILVNAGYVVAENMEAAVKKVVGLV
jgi:succinyl-CoA synthetase beta subunit